MSYETEMKYYSDYVHTVAFAEKKGVEKGMKKGILQTARAMLRDGLKPVRVARITNLPKEEIFGSAVKFNFLDIYFHLPNPLGTHCSIP
jgi:predicted transposase/invertase (TIGR01784 family)